MSEGALQENNGNTPAPPHWVLKMRVWAPLVYFSVWYLLRFGREVWTHTRTPNTHTEKTQDTYRKHTTQNKAQRLITETHRHKLSDRLWKSTEHNYCVHFYLVPLFFKARDFNGLRCWQSFGFSLFYANSIWELLFQTIPHHCDSRYRNYLPGWGGGGTGDTQFTSQFSELPGAVEALGVAGRAGPRMQHCSPRSGSLLATLRQQQRTGRASTCRKGPKENVTRLQRKGRKPKRRVHALSPVKARLGPVVVMVINFVGKGRSKVDN